MYLKLFFPISLLIPVFFMMLFAPICSGAETHDLADKYWEQAQALSRQKKYIEAAKVFAQSARSEEACPEPRLFALASQYNQAAYHCFLAEQRDKSADFYQKALKVTTKLDDIAALADLLGNLGYVYSNWEEYKKSIEYYQKATTLN